MEPPRRRGFTAEGAEGAEGRRGGKSSLPSPLLPSAPSAPSAVTPLRLSDHPLTPDRHPPQRLRVDLDPQPAARQRLRPAAAAERQVLRPQRLAHQVPVVTALDVAQPADARGEVPARGRQDGRLADLAAQLTA